MGTFIAASAVLIEVLKDKSLLPVEDETGSKVFGFERRI
jgi:hypothetical protein